MASGLAIPIVPRTGPVEKGMPMHLCERCNKPATVHMTEISGGKPHEVHLCDKCAQAAGHVQQSHVPINELLNQFLKAHAQVGDAQTTRCPDCGMSWQEFKDTGLLGCPKDYDLFVNQLGGVVEPRPTGRDAPHRQSRFRADTREKRRPRQTPPAGTPQTPQGTRPRRRR